MTFTTNSSDTQHVPMIRWSEKNPPPVRSLEIMSFFVLKQSIEIEMRPNNNYRNLVCVYI